MLKEAESIWSVESLETQRPESGKKSYYECKVILLTSGVNLRETRNFLDCACSVLCSRIFLKRVPNKKQAKQPAPLGAPGVGVPGVGVPGGAGFVDT